MICQLLYISINLLGTGTNLKVMIKTSSMIKSFFFYTKEVKVLKVICENTYTIDRGILGNNDCRIAVYMNSLITKEIYHSETFPIKYFISERVTNYLTPQH